MSETKSDRRIVLLSGMITALCLVGPIIFMLTLAFVLEQLTNQTRSDLEPVFIGLLLVIAIAAGGLWGRALARLANIGRQWLMTLGGAFGLAPAVALDIWLLLTLDEQFHIFRGVGFDGLPEHNQYMLIFVTSAFIVATLSALVLNIAAGINFGRAFRNAALTGVVAAVSFALVILGMDLIGYRVGSGSVHAGLLPDVPAMPAVTILASIVGAMAGGGTLGWLFNKNNADIPEASPEPVVSLS